jgi:hypothetical protein
MMLPPPAAIILGASRRIMRNGPHTIVVLILSEIGGDEHEIGAFSGEGARQIRTHEAARAGQQHTLRGQPSHRTSLSEIAKLNRYKHTQSWRATASM